MIQPERCMELSELSDLAYLGDRNKHQTKNKTSLVVARHSTSTFARSFPNTGSTFFNLLPVHSRKYAILNFEKKLIELIRSNIN